MAFTSYQLFLAGLMLITGTLNTISTKWADKQEAHFCDKSVNATEFQHPFLQAVGMFIGEISCLLVFKFIWYSTARYRISTMTYKGDASASIVQCWPIHINKEIHLTDGEQDFNPLILWIPALFDMTSTCLGYFALNFISAGTFQMLRGSVMVFTALFSFLFLKKKLTLLQWLGIFTVIAGLVIVGLVSVLSPGNGGTKATAGQQVLGIILLLSGMVFTGLQMVYEERYIGQYNIPPLQVVGWEGIFGFVSLSFLLIPLNFITWDQSQASPDHRLEHIPSAFCQMADNYIIIIATIGNIFSIAFFNFSGVSVTKELSSTTRMVLDNCRTVIIYIISVTAFGADFHGLDILGLILLIIGVGIYNGVWAHLYKVYVRGERPGDETSSLVARNEETAGYGSSTYEPKTSSNAEVYNPSDKDSVNR